MTYNSSERDFYLRHYNGGVVFTEPDFAKIHAEFLQPGKRYHLLYQTLQLHRRNGTIIEVGCGDAGVLMFLKSKFEFSRAIGFDIGILQDQIFNGVELKSGNFNETLNLEDGSVDVFIAMMVIEHLFDPFHAFKEIKRVLKSDGLAVLNLPLVTNVQNRIRLLCGHLPTTSVPYDRWFLDKEYDGNHLHYFSMQSIRKIAQISGLSVAAVSGVGRCQKLKSLFPSFFAGEITFSLKHAN
jgi:SAM-dependent methyltransferase